MQIIFRWWRVLTTSWTNEQCNGWVPNRHCSNLRTIPASSKRIVGEEIWSRDAATTLLPRNTSIFATTGLIWKKTRIHCWIHSLNTLFEIRHLSAICSSLSSSSVSFLSVLNCNWDGNLCLISISLSPMQFACNILLLFRHYNCYISYGRYCNRVYDWVYWIYKHNCSPTKWHCLQSIYWALLHHKHWQAVYYMGVKLDI